MTNANQLLYSALSRLSRQMNCLEHEMAHSASTALALMPAISNCLTAEEQTQMLFLIEKVGASMETLNQSSTQNAHHPGIQPKHAAHFGVALPPYLDFYEKG